MMLSSESIKFYDKDDSVRARTNMILAGKCGSHRHSATSFRKNVVVANRAVFI